MRGEATVSELFQAYEVTLNLAQRRHGGDLEWQSCTRHLMCRLSKEIGRDLTALRDFQFNANLDALAKVSTDGGIVLPGRWS